MKAIWKFLVLIECIESLDGEEFVALDMPANAEILGCQLQGDDMVLWAIVNSSRERVRRRISIVGTGNDCEGRMLSAYIGTVQMPKGLVWHLFDLGEWKR